MAEWDDRDDQLVAHVSTQVPHQVRSGIAQALGVAEGRIRVIAPDVGGGFGLKCVVGREEVVVAAAAMRLRRPVAWVEDRGEHLLAIVGPRVANHVLETLHDAYPDRFPLSPTLANYADGTDEMAERLGIDPLKT